MADTTSKKLLELLQPEHPGPVRRSAVTVLGVLGGKDKELAGLLCDLLDDPDLELRAEVIQVIGKLRIDKALSRLVERAAAGGPESELATQALANLGARGVRALQELMAHTAPGLRRRIAAALAAGGSATAELAAIQILLDSDPGVVHAAVRTLVGEVRSWTNAQRRSLADQILDLLKPKKKEPLAAHSEAAFLRLLATVGDPRALPIFWSRTESTYPAELRAEALQALGSAPPPTSGPTFKRLLQCAVDADFRVVAPALMILKGIPASGKNLKEWLGLLQAPDVASRRFAIDKLAGQDKAEVAAALLLQLKHPDRTLRDQSLAALAQRKHGRDALANQLLQAESTEEAWQLARAQADLVKEYSPALWTKLFNRACANLDNEDRRADALLFALRHADAKELRDRLADRALALRKKKQYAKAILYLRLLGQDPACGEGLRFELAACGLKLSSQDLAAAGRAADPCLHQFARLVHSHEKEPLTYLQKASWLAPEDLYYLGFHFVSNDGPERLFGGQVLQLLLKRSPRSKIATDARRKLKNAGPMA